MARKNSNQKSNTIEEVAAAAGVSTMTVSRVLRGTGNVSAKTCEKVQSSIAELGYVHNRLAGALAASHSAQIAVIIPTLQSIVFTEVLAGIAEALDGSGYQPIIGITEYDLQRECELVKSMMGWRPAGFVLANSHHLSDTVRILSRASVPVVEVMELTRKPIDICVGLNHWDAGKTMAQHLIKRGYKRFAYLGTDPGLDRAAAKRYAGFKSVISKSEASLVATMNTMAVSGINLGREHMPELLAKAEHIDVVYFSNDAVATGAMLYCMSAGISVPQDIALASFSGLEIAAALPCPITTIRSPRHEMGKMAGDRIRARLRGDKVKRVTDAGFELIEGMSA